MSRSKLTVRPTEIELNALYKQSELAGYKSLSAYLIDCGLNPNSLLPPDRRDLESLKFHVRLFSSALEEKGKSKGKQSSESLPPALLLEMAQRANEALRLIDKIVEPYASKREVAAA